MRIDIAVYDGLDELDALGPYEVLKSAASISPDWSVRLVTRLEGRWVAGAFGLRFAVDGRYEPGADVLIVPGGGWASQATTGAWGEVQRGDWLPLLREAAESGTILAGVCTGAMLLAHAGVIGSRRASTHQLAKADLAATGATVLDERVVEDGDLVTSGGVTSGIDLALWLVERVGSRDVADKVARRMDYARTRPSTAP